ncbi:MAG: zinc-dependent peptidase [Gammaproteobacteria bacterium]|nr:zinc-dependent peptidase [Gammaproteobacteria bacterium]
MSRHAVALLVAAAVLLTPLWLALGRGLLAWRHRRRGPRRLPAHERALLRARCPLYVRLPAAVRIAAEARTLDLLRGLRFIGCAGLAVTPAMRLLIAFQASLLLARLGTEVCRELGAILIYPDDFLAPRSFIDEAGVVTEGHELLSGESVDTARIVLSWPDVQAGLEADAGINVVLHEFAHFLDHALDGALSAPGNGPGPHALLTAEYQALRAAVDAGEDTLIDPYGAEDPAEFLAVATEAFFQRPRALHTRHAGLYRLLAGLYALDPARWS